MEQGEPTAALVKRLRRVGMEPAEIEVKAAVGGLSKSVPETLSAFANGSGGTLLLGLSEADGFRPAPGFDAAAIRDSLAGACADRVSPPIREPIEVEEFEGALVVRLEVPEADPMTKPCFVVGRGDYNGSYIRGGDDGDRKLTRYEVTQLLSRRTQPAYDREVVPDATVDDLDPKLLTAFLGQVRSRSSRIAAMPDAEALQRLNVIGIVDDTPRPTVAGLLCLGSFPQSFLPQLFVSFVAVPGVAMGETTAGGERFVDNQTLDGPIPDIVADATRAAIRNMNRAAVIKGIGREDRYDYPLDVIRELVVNALMHRDYSPEARGSQIQIEVYSDRLEIRSPGGLHGPVTEDELGTIEQRSTSRNAVLAQMLTDIYTPGPGGEALCENRGSGLRSVVKSLQRAGMSPPNFRVTPGAVDVVVPRHALLSKDVISWINDLDQPDLNDAQRVALAIMRGGSVTNAMLRTWGYDQQSATQALRDLVVRGLASKAGGRRYATYRLSDASGDGQQTLPGLLDDEETTRSGRAEASRPESDEERIINAIRAGHLTSRAIAEATGLKYQPTLRRLGRLVQRRAVGRTGATNSPTQSYRIVDEEPS